MITTESAVQQYTQVFNKHGAIPWGSIGKGLSKFVVGPAAGAWGGYQLSNGMADTIGVDQDTRKIPVDIAAILGAASGHNIANAGIAAQEASSLQRAAVASGKKISPQKLKAMKESVTSAINSAKLNIVGQLGTDVGLGGGTGVVKSWKANLDANTSQIHSAMDAAKNNFHTMADNFPGGLGGLVAAGVLSLTGAAALAQVARAASRVADGHVIRSSISLRKRPGQITDVNLGLMPFNAKDERLNPMRGRIGGPGALDYGDTRGVANPVPPPTAAIPGSQLIPSQLIPSQRQP